MTHHTKVHAAATASCTACTSHLALNPPGLQVLTTQFSACSVQCDVCNNQVAVYCTAYSMSWLLGVAYRYMPRNCGEKAFINLDYICFALLLLQNCNVKKKQFLILFFYYKNSIHNKFSNIESSQTGELDLFSIHYWFGYFLW